MMERMDRRWESIPAADIETLARKVRPEEYSNDWMVDQEHFVYADRMLGQKLTLRFDEGPVLTYDFCEKTRCRYTVDGGEERESFYRAIPDEGHPDVVLIHQYLDGIVPATCHTIVLDLGTGYCTLIRAQVGVLPVYPREVTRNIFFGTIDGIAHPEGSEKHGYTEALVGKAIEWTMPGFVAGKEPMKHAYVAPKYYLIHMTRGNTCFMSADPADYVKIRDDLILVSIVEQRRSGIQLSFLINTELVRDITARFGISAGNEVGQDEPRIMCNLLLGRTGRFVPVVTHYEKA